MMKTVWLASNSAPAHQIAAIQRQRVECAPVRVSIMAAVYTDVIRAKSAMQRTAIAVQ
jgi:hypothetical protein